MSAIGFTVEGEATEVVEVVANSARCRLAIVRRPGRAPTLSLRVTNRHGPLDVRTVKIHAADLEALEAGIEALRESASKETP